MKPSQSNYWNQVDGWCSQTEADFLYELVLGLRKRSKVLEVGAWHGKSTIPLALACKEISGQVFTIDHFLGSPGEKEHEVGIGPNGHQDILRVNLSLMDVLDCVHIYPYNCIDAIKHMPLATKFKFMYIDGAHTSERVMGDYYIFRDLLASDALVAFHDYAIGGWPTVQAAVSDLVRTCELVEVSQRGSIGVFRKGENK